MANQYVMLTEETTRGSDPGSGYETYPVIEAPEPQPSFNDAPRSEFRGEDTALGPVTDVRRAFNVAWSLIGFWYPDSGILGTLFKHLYGYSSTSIAIDTSAYQTNYYPLSMPYGTGMTLGSKAIGVVPNTDDGAGTTKSRYVGGMRHMEGFNIEVNPAEDVKITMPFQGPGQYLGTLTTAVTSAGLPTIDPYVGSNVTCFIGSGVSLTGTAPDYTEIGEGTMDQVKPDTLSITITPGRSDKSVIDGVEGANQTTRTDGSPFKVEVKFVIDYADPATGFSPADLMESHYAGLTYQPFLVKFTSPTLAGASTEYYEDILYFPRLFVKGSPKTLSSTGGQPTIEYTFESRNDETAEKPMFHQSTNQNSAV